VPAAFQVEAVASHGVGVADGLARLNMTSGSKMRPSAPIPWIGAFWSKGLKSLVMVVSGEDSITTVALDELPLECEAPDVLLEDEQAATPAARSPAAVMAASRLPLKNLVVNIEYTLGC
jgi:hypothetical protein